MSCCLLIDIGNTCIKWGYTVHDQYCAGGRITYKGMTVEALCSLMLSSADYQPSRVYYISVADASLTSQIEDSLKNTNCYVTRLFTSVEEFGLKNGYSNPQSLGVDRWYAMIAAHYLSKKKFVVVDLGTALTFDVVNFNGLHEGGCIMPGLNSMLKLLVASTSAISPISRDLLSLDDYGRTTQEGVLQGVYRSIKNFIDVEVDKIMQVQNNDADLYITGGDADSVLPLLKHRWHHHPDLVLYGLHLKYINDYKTKKLT